MTGAANLGGNNLGGANYVGDNLGRPRPTLLDSPFSLHSGDGMVNSGLNDGLLYPVDVIEFHGFFI